MLHPPVQIRRIVLYSFEKDTTKWTCVSYTQEAAFSQSDGAGITLLTGGSAISTRDLTGTADNHGYEYAWKSDEIELIGAIMSAAVADSAEPGTVTRGSPASPAAIETSRYPLSRAVALLTGKLMAFLA